MEGPAAARVQQRVEELCAAALRAVAGERDLHYRGARVHRGRRPLPLFAPHLHPRVEDDDFASFRGAADGVALRLRFSDAALHERLRPAGPIARTVFDLLEQFRVESLADPALPGLAHNLRHRFAQWSIGFHRAGLTESDRGLLLYTVAQITRSRVTGEPVLEETEDLMETTRGALVPAIGHALAGLRRTHDDQAAYAVHAREVAELVSTRDRTSEELRLAAEGGDHRRLAELGEELVDLERRLAESEELWLELAAEVEERGLHL